MLSTLIVCLAGCGAPTTPADEIGALAAGYLQACHEMHVLQRSRCPALQPPVLLQCVNDIERELPSKFRPDFRNGLRVLEQKFSREVPSIAERRYTELFDANGGDSALACQSAGADNAHRRLQMMRQLKSFGRNP